MTGGALRAKWSEFMTRKLRDHPGLAIALLVYLGLAFSYFFIVPIFEGPDEWTHTGHVKYIAAGQGLPVMLPGQGIWGGQQPPLYYALGALLVQPFELDGVEAYEAEARNPHAAIGYALDPGNKNNYLHKPAESFPYRGLALTVHLLRLYSMSFGLIALIFTYLTALEFMAEVRPQAAPFFAALVALLVAGQPMFAFITASVANEPANIAFCAAGLWLAQRYILHGPTPQPRRAIALGLLLGLISLSKMTGLALGLVAIVAMLQVAIATRKTPGQARLLWRDGLIIGLLFLATGGWWYWRNYRLYGDFFQQGLYKIYFNVDPQPLSLADFLYTLSTGEVSFWATFGWLNIVAPPWVYDIYWVISRLGLLSLALAAIVQLGRRLLSSQNIAWADRKGTSPPQINGQPTSYFLLPASCFLLHVSRFTFHASRFTLPPPLLIHLLFPTALAFSLTRLVAIEGGLQGRQLLPALGSLAIVILWGWRQLVPPSLWKPVMLVLFSLLVGLAAWLPYGVVAPEYIPKPLLTEAELPPDLARLDHIYQDDMKLIGVKVGVAQVRPGQRVPVTAYWQALRPMETNYSVFVHLIGRNYTNAGQMNSYPGLGLRPTRTLQPGQIVADTYPVLVNGGSQAPTRLLVNIGLFDFKEAGRPGIPPRAPDGSPASSTAGQLKLIPHHWPARPDRPPVAEFADHIHLLDYTFNNCQTPTATCELVLKWLALDRPAGDYTVFIQLWDHQEFMAGFDAPPLANDYPTRLWEAGEVILDPHSLDLTAMPVGDYQVWLGLYDFASGARLAVAAATAPRLDNALDLGTISISPKVPGVK